MLQAVINLTLLIGTPLGIYLKIKYRDNLLMQDVLFGFRTFGMAPLALASLLNLFGIYVY
jgi:uncharacterized membrane protein